MNKKERMDDVIMNLNKEFDLFIDELLTRAVGEFKSTEQYSLLKEKLEIMDRDCETMFAKDEKEFATECFELILYVDGQEEQYVYRKGLRDCVWLLKTLGVLV